MYLNNIPCRLSNHPSNTDMGRGHDTDDSTRTYKSPEIRQNDTLGTRLGMYKYVVIKYKRRKSKSLCHIRRLYTPFSPFLVHNLQQIVIIKEKTSSNAPSIYPINTYQKLIENLMNAISSHSQKELTNSTTSLTKTKH